MPRRCCWALILLLAPFAVPFAAWADAAGLDTLGPLAPHVRLQPDGTPWRVAPQDGALLMENATAPGEVTYFFVQPRDHPLRVAAQVTAAPAGAPDDVAGGGILFGLQGQGSARLYYVFLLSPDGTLSVIRRDEKGAQRLLATRSDKIDPARPVELAVVETGDGTELHAGGERIGTIRARGTGAGSVGIAALGTGRFPFRDFRIGEAAGRQ